MLLNNVARWNGRPGRRDHLYSHHTYHIWCQCHDDDDDDDDDNDNDDDNSQSENEDLQVICEIARWLLPIMGRSGHQVILIIWLENNKIDDNDDDADDEDNDDVENVDQDTPTLQQKYQLATSYLQVLDRSLDKWSPQSSKKQLQYKN